MQYLMFYHNKKLSWGWARRLLVQEWNAQYEPIPKTSFAIFQLKACFLSTQTI